MEHPPENTSQRTERTWIEAPPEVQQACHCANNLYNEAMYRVRQEFFKTGNWLRYTTLYEELKVSVNYTQLPAPTAQQILRLVDHDWETFFKCQKDYFRQPEKYLGRPGIPHYKTKGGEMLLIFTNQQLRWKENTILFPGRLQLRLPTQLLEHTLINGARIIPKGFGYLVEIIYTIGVPQKSLFIHRMAAIDLGIDNLITMINNIGNQPIVIKGKNIKALNQWFNKRLAELKSIYAKTGVKPGEAQLLLQCTRYQKIQAYFHKVSRWIVQYCQARQITFLVMGYNPFWKQGVTMGKKTNQTFVSLPFTMLLQQLQYKCQSAGIHFQTSPEYYTSKCSFLDGEAVERHKHYLGRRIHRGIFCSAQKILINADVNAAYNILRNVCPYAFDQWSSAEGVVDVKLLQKFRGLHPKCIHLNARPSKVSII